MGTEDIIGLEPSSPNNDTGEENGDLKGSGSAKADMASPASSFPTKENYPASENGDGRTACGENKDDPSVLDMDLEEDIVRHPPILYERAELSTSRLEIGSKRDIAAVGDATLSNCTSNNLSVDESPIAGVKRARMAYAEKQPSVRVIFNSLTRESKRKLVELMQQWAHWQTQYQLSSNELRDGLLEDGEETYFPALHINAKKSNFVVGAISSAKSPNDKSPNDMRSFWVDNQARQDDDKDKDQFEAEVPIYNREFTLRPSSADGSSAFEGMETLGASRCFNCGSYSHVLKECSKPRDHVAISNARKIHSNSRNSKRNPSDHGQARYYQKAPGKFDNLCAGVLGPETRECLGIGEYDPPPWHHRMREMGYPPGYLEDEDENQPSGITIFVEEKKEEEYEDGELPERSEPEPPLKKMTVAFPGINAPIPENADQRRWSAQSTGSGSNSPRNSVHQRSNLSSDNSKGYYHEQRWSSDLRDSGTDSEREHSSSYSRYSLRYSPYNHNPTSRSTNLDKSLSDRGLRSPLPYETSPAHSPHVHHSAQQTARDHYRIHDHWNHDSSYSRSTDITSSQRSHDRHDHPSHHHYRYHHWR